MIRISEEDLLELLRLAFDEGAEYEAGVGVKFDGCAALQEYKVLSS